ncbi:SulP family inorganic anion transporter [Oceanobacter mangrovi]|uniref:SulP family inorganic anion transporter n=1 Tax=Oceanobacter mangrovi TaxID=2862510 RepID=UPI001C8E08B7|nr:SulP family inorganic anion transporter [Oceanobacter mangrovi]
MNTKSASAKDTVRTGLPRWLPFLQWAPQLSGSDVRADLVAGLTGAVMVLPQGVAYALIAGMPAQYGLYGAMVIAALAALFGCSRHMVTGPAAALSIMLLSVLAPLATPGSAQFIEMTLLLTLLAGLIQLGLGLLRAGNLVSYISHTVVVGFTSGAAILIASSQLGHALGLERLAAGSLFEQWQQLLAELPLTDWRSLLIAVATMLATLACKRWVKRIPSMLAGMLAGSLLCWWLDGSQQGVAMVGEISSSWPVWHLPQWSLETLALLLPGALTVALLGLVEAAAISRSIAIRSGQRIDANQEFIGQGLANTVGSLFSCFAGSGSFTRSGLNYDAGARSPLAVVSSAVFLLLILLLWPDITRWLPLPAMAGGILLIAWNLFDLQQIRHLRQSDRREWLVFVITLLATLTIRLEFAVLLGVVVSLLLHLDKTARPNVVEVAPLQAGSAELRNAARLGLALCPAIRILRIDGPLFFGSADHVQQAIQRCCNQYPNTRQLLLSCTGVNHIDLAGSDMLQQQAERLQQQGIQLSICWLKQLVQQQTDAAALVQALGPNAVFEDIDSALQQLVLRVNQQDSPCLHCQSRIFRYCPMALAESPSSKAGEASSSRILPGLRSPSYLDDPLQPGTQS